MYENQLIQFAKAINPKECCMPVPIVFDRSGIAFYVPANEQANTIFTIVDASGEPLLHNGKELSGRFVNMRNNYVRAMFASLIPDAVYRTQQALFKAEDMRNYVAPHECFRIRMDVPDEERGTVSWYSNLLFRCENENNECSYVEYTCGTYTFGLPFTIDMPIRQWLPILLDNPKPVQNDEIYETLSGKRVVMFATINKEYEAQTDYIPYDWHERIVIALSCDKVKVNGELLTKSDKYEVDWQNVAKTDCGIKTMRATWKMAANVTSRNTND